MVLNKSLQVSPDIFSFSPEFHKTFPNREDFLIVNNFLPMAAWLMELMN